MRTVFAIFVLWGTLLFAAEQEIDPFAEPPQKLVDLSKNKGSAEFLSDDLLKALEEPCLDKGTGKKGSDVIRITVLRSFHSPVVFKWFPGSASQKPSLQMKRLKIRKDEDGERFYAGIEISNVIELRPGQEANLKKLFENASFSKLSQQDWQEMGTDGSTWIYEAASESAAILIARLNPINPSQSVNYSSISKERLLQETNLTSFALMVWALSGIDDDALY